MQADTGVKVSGAFDSLPTLTFPSRGASSQLLEQILQQGSGPAIGKGDTVVTNYIGEIWPSTAGGQAKVFDSSFSRGAPSAFVIGTGAVIPGFDKTLMGQRMGSRVLLSIPPSDGYGATGNSQAGISGTDTLVFVVDLLTDYKPDASAPGVVDDQVPAAGWPKITSVPGQQPKILGVAGVKAPTSPESELLVHGSGAAINPAGNLVLQVVATDIATGTANQTTWGQQPQLSTAQNVLSIITALKGQTVGSRAVALLPAIAAQPATATAVAQAATPAEVVVVDVVGQY